MYILEMHKLEEGDILLTSQKGIVSKTVRGFTSGDFSHAILYVGHGSYIHSDGDGVHSGNIQRLLFENDKFVKILRPINSSVAGSASMYARSQIGKQYSVKDAIRTKVQIARKGSNNRQFCSRLVAQSFEYAGVQLVSDSSYCTPQEINESTELCEVVDVLRGATEAEINFAQSYDPILRQSEITNHILSSARKLMGHDIQSLEDLSYYVINNPKYDSHIVKIFKDSGYLSMWEYDMEQNPWRYDGNEFLSLPIDDEEKIQLASFEMESAKKQLQLYSQNYLAFQQLSLRGMLSYIRMEMQLYKNLINQMNKRLKAAKYVLENT